MNLSSLQPGHSLDVRVDHQLAAADSFSGVCSAFAPGQRPSGLPGKAIGQRGCEVDRLGDADCAGPDSEIFDARTNRQQEPAAKTNDDDGSWQVVTRRRSKCRRQQPPVVAPGEKSGGARAKNGALKKRASASQLPENSPADNGVTGQNQRQRLCSSDPISLSSITSCSYWPLCIKSFARLSELDWISFHAALVKFRKHHRQTKITREDFLRFQRLMTEGLPAIRATDDTVFLADLFKVLLFMHKQSSDALLLSLVVERIAPGFLSMLGERFICRLAGVDRKRGELFTAATELLAQICQEDERWLERLGWEKLIKRHQCNLFSSMAFLFKQSNNIALIQSLHRQVSGSWLENHYYAMVQRLSCDTVRSNPDAGLSDLKASLRATYFWLESRLFVISKAEERSDLIVRYARICEALLDAMGRFAPPPTLVLLSLWRTVGQQYIFFRKHLSQHLGFDRTIALLKGLLKHFDRWPELESLAFELRQTLLGTVLTKCEELLLKRDSSLFSQAWRQYENLLRSLLSYCNRFMGRYQPPLPIDDRETRDRCKEGARLDLLLRESKFRRLDCEIRKATRQQVQDNLHKFRIVFKGGWGLSRHCLEIGTIELAKWNFLAGEHDAGISSLMGFSFDLTSMSWKKAELLANYGVFQAAVDEFCRVKVLMTDSGQATQRKRDEADGRIAMVQLQWYEAENGIDHLISAYRLSVDLLGRCDIQDRERYEGILAHIVNAMNKSGLRFEDYVEQTSVLGYLVKDGCSIKSWGHFADLLYIRRKLGLTSADSVNKVADEIGEKHGFFLGLDKKS